MIRLPTILESDVDDTCVPTYDLYIKGISGYWKVMTCKSTHLSQCLYHVHRHCFKGDTFILADHIDSDRGVDLIPTTVKCTITTDSFTSTTTAITRDSYKHICVMRTFFSRLGKFISTDTSDEELNKLYLYYMEMKTMD